MPMATLTAPAPVYDLTFGEVDDDWTWPAAVSPRPPLPRAASTSYGYGVTVIGKGFEWGGSSGGGNTADKEEQQQVPTPTLLHKDLPAAALSSSSSSRTSTPNASDLVWPSPRIRPPPPPPLRAQSTSAHIARRIAQPLPMIASPRARHAGGPVFTTSPIASPISSRPGSPSSSLSRPPYVRSPTGTRPTTPRFRRRSSQQRVSLIAGRLSILSVADAGARHDVPQRLVRSGSARSFLSVASSVAPPTPNELRDEFLIGRSLSEFVIEREIGRGAYGVVKRAREMDENGKMGPPLVIKQIIKTRILADCWKRHPKHGTIPIEIYVMNSISSTSYALPARRPWDPLRRLPEAEQKQHEDEWIEGKIVKGHPNICPMLDFFEDDQFYYMVMPSLIPEPAHNEPPPPSDLFDLVENYPTGLPPDMIRSYLGQIADAMSFLHSKEIVHRDIKDENVILGPRGRAILIDFGSSGLVRKAGWDTFSGTLDYAGPEILRGERYHGKEQDVWAFGVVAFVLLVGECPFTTAAEAQDGLDSPFSNARIALDERVDGHAQEGVEADGGGALGDAEALVRACLRVDLAARPSFDRILQSRFLMGRDGWSHEEENAEVSNAPPVSHMD